MGIKLFSDCSCDCSNNSNRRVTGNPDSLNFKILRHKKINRFLVILIKYPDCTNYEGSKILVFENIDVDTLKKSNSIDPHFCESDIHPSPIARFVPTSAGWDYAVLFCKNA